MKNQTNYLIAFYDTNKPDYEIDTYILEHADYIIKGAKDIIRNQFNDLVNAKCKAVMALFDEDKEFKISYNPNR